MTTKTEAGVSRLLNALRELGGTQFHSDDITVEGSKIVVPSRLGIEGTIAQLERHLVVMETPTEFSHTFRYRPYDGAAAVHRALVALTGTAGLPKGTFFQRPQMVSVQVGVEDTVQVPWGLIEVPLIGGTIQLGYSNHPEYGPLFEMTVTAPRKYAGEIEGLFRLVEDELVRNSIYKGRAIDGQPDPEFVDLRGVNRDRVVYSEAVWDQLNANVFALIDHTEAMRRNDVPLKRTVLVHGPYGTGKTLLSALCGQSAVNNGWTFILCRPGKDDLGRTLQTARLYQPSVVFFEDIDAVADEAEASQVTKLLDMFDGIRAKGTEILAIMTTNHPERIHKGMLRPGRLDAVIEIGALDEPGFERLVNVTVPADQLATDLDWSAVAAAYDGFLPAFAVEAIQRAQRYAIARNDGEPDTLTDVDLIAAADGLRPQLAMMEAAAEGTRPPEMEIAFTAAVQKAVGDMRIVESDERWAAHLVNGDG